MIAAFFLSLIFRLILSLSPNANVRQVKIKMKRKIMNPNQPFAGRQQ